MSSVSVVIFNSARAEDRLARACSWLVAGGRTRETLVVGATTHAARALVRQATVVAGASFGWRPITLGRLALALGTPRMVEGRLAAAGAAIVEALSVRTVHRLREQGGLGRLAAIADRPGLARAVARTLSEVRMAGLRPADLQGHAPEIAALLRELESHLEADRLADRAALFQMAIGALAGDGVARPALLLLDVPVWTGLEARLIAAVARGAPETLATVPAGDGRTVEALRAHLPEARVVDEKAAAAGAGALGRLQRSLFAGAPAVVESGERGDDVVFMSAPGESREAVEIARRVLREAEAGVPFDRMAVLLRAPAQYRAHMEEAFRRARVPVHFAGGAVQPDPAGRAFLALLACLEEGLSARRFAEYLSLGESPRATEANEPPAAAPATERWVPPEEELVPGVLAEEGGEDEDADAGGDADGDAAEAVVGGTVRAPHRWEKILVDAAVIGGKERWARRLAGWREELTLRLGELEPDSPYIEVTRREIGHLEALRSFALPILDDLLALPASASWGDWLDRLSALATRTLRWPDRVLAVLAELAPMAPVGPVGLAEVRLALARRLGNLVVRPGDSTAGRVFVGPVAAARGLAFEVVFVPGLAERMFPPRVGQDPLLRDEVRAAVGTDLETDVDRIAAERLALRLGVGAARRRVVLSYSRVDAEQARPRVPSFYGLEVLRAVEGRLPSFEALAGTVDRGGATRLGWPAPADPGEAIDEAEHDLALLDRLVRPAAAPVTGAARYLVTANRHLARALRHRAMRFDRRWSFADGLVLVKPDEPGRAALAAHALEARSFSPTALQNFAACPYRFVLHTIHRLAPREEPAAIEKIDPLNRGSLVHETLFELLTDLRDRGLVPITADNYHQARAALDGILDRVAARYRDTLAPAIARVWDDEVAAIRADLLEALQRETRRAPWTPWKLELAFGLSEGRGRDPSSTAEPVPLDCGIRLRGSIDVVEHSVDGALRATDHKTGKARQRPGTVIGGGESLQPVFYALALEKLFPGRRVAGGRLSYCTSAGDFKEVAVPLDRAARDAADKVAAAVGQGLARGFLPAVPARDACRYCDYRPVCGPWEEERTRKKQHSEALEALAELRRQP